MRLILTIILNLLFLSGVFAQNAPNIFTTDIDNFWTAYDKIVTTKDNAEQLEYLNKLFIEKASPGQQEMFKARRYTPQEYIDAINKRPEYWARIRPNTLKAKDFAADFETGIEELRKIYPELRPANIYFTVGVFRSGGTTSGNNILIGSETIFGDEKLMNSLALTNVHEYVHTQQKTTLINNLLAQSVMEGVAEFVSVKALQTQSTAPAINYGKNNESNVKNAFILQMLNIDTGFWLYSDAKNDFNTRDLGYCSSSVSSQGLTMINSPFSRVSEFLQTAMKTTVIDETGIAGTYDLEIPYFNEDPNRIYAELKKIGLGLIDEKRSMETLVIYDK